MVLNGKVAALSNSIKGDVLETLLRNVRNVALASLNFAFTRLLGLRGSWRRKALWLRSLGLWNNKRSNLLQEYRLGEKLYTQQCIASNKDTPSFRIVTLEEVDKNGTTVAIRSLKFKHFRNFFHQKKDVRVKMKISRPQKRQTLLRKTYITNNKLMFRPILPNSAPNPVQMSMSPMAHFVTELIRAFRK